VVAVEMSGVSVGGGWSGSTVVDVVSDGAGEFGEGSREPMSWVDIQTEL
jgi:hypothetical protein